MKDNLQRCNHCMSVFDEKETACPKCGKDDALMCPFEETKIDLNKCKAGDKLRSKHGMILTYVEKSTRPVHVAFPHIVKYPDGEPYGGSIGSRTHDGYVYNNPSRRMESDHDIIEIIPAT